MEKYIIGLDLGINNVGWAIINEEKNTLEKTGVRIYTTSDVAKERREARNTRRRMKRRKNRVEETLKLFQSISFPNNITTDEKLIDKRVKGLHQKLEKQDIVNIVSYFMMHRGYIPFGDEERELVELAGKFPCEYYQQLQKELGKYRALEKVVNHSDLNKELNQLMETQSQYYPELKKIMGSTEDKAGIKWIFSRKRQFWEGPGSIESLTPYGRFKTKQDVEEYKSSAKEKFLYEDLVAKCNIYPDEKCVPKANYYAELFNLLNDFINITVNNQENILNQDFIEQISHTDNYKLTEKALDAIIEYVKESTKKSLSYKEVLKSALGLSKEDISGYRIDKKGNPEFSLLKSYRSVRNMYLENNIDNSWISNIDNYNQLIAILAVAPGIVEAEKMLSEYHKITQNELEVIKQIQDKLKKNQQLQYHALGTSALIRSIKDMKQECKNFMQVSKEHDYEKEARERLIKGYGSGEGRLQMSSKYVDDLIASPQVKKTLRQAIRIINAIIKEKGEYPSVICVESAKEMNGEERKKEIEKDQRAFEQRRKDAMQILEKHTTDDKITPKNIEKVIAYLETDGHCAYCNKPVSLNEVLNGTYETEHILPLSQSADDSFDNRTIACRDCNETKKNKTPYQFIGKEKYDEFVKRVISGNFSEQKKKNFLTTEDINKYNIRFINRNLRDTAYATKELINQIKLFNEYLNCYLKDVQINTLSTPGQLTHKIRKQWDLEKNRDIGNFHHAQDASIVAAIATTPLGKEIIKSQNESKYWILNKEKSRTIGDEVYKFSLPKWKEKIQEIDSDEKIQKSVQVNKDASRSIANANIISFVKKENQYYKICQISDIYQKDLMKNEKKNLDVLFDENNSKLTLLCQENNPKLFNLLKEIYMSYQDNGENPFYNYVLEQYEFDSFDVNKHAIKTPSKKGKGVPVVKLRYMQAVETPFLLEKKNIHKKENTLIGLDSVAIYCTEVYWDIEHEKLLFVPVYVPAVNPETKEINRNHIIYKTYADKTILGKNVKHIVSLYNGDYLEIDKGNKIIKGYVKGYHKNNRAIVLKTGEYLSTQDSFKVIDTDVLGNQKIRLTWPDK